MRAPGRRSRRAIRRDELRGALMEAVERLLDGGEAYAELSVDRLAGEAGISRSTFYIYFEDKAELLHAAFEDVIRELNDATMSWWDIDGARVSAETLRATLDGVLRTYHPHARVMATVFDAAAHDPGIRGEVEAFMERGIVALRRHIERGQREGTVDPGLWPDETARWLLWMAERGQHQMTATADAASLEALIDTYSAIVWRTLYAFAPARIAA